MAQNLIRLKQIEKSELSGFIVDALTTGLVFNASSISGRSFEGDGIPGESVYVSAGLKDFPGSVFLQGNIFANYGVNSDASFRYYSSGAPALYPLVRIEDNKISIGTGLSTSFTPNELVYLQGDIYANNLVYNTGEQIIRSEKFYEYVTDSSRKLPVIIKVNSNQQILDSAGELGATGLYDVSGSYVLSPNLKYYVKQNPSGPFYIYFCDQDKCLQDKYAWSLFTSLSGGVNLYYNSGDVVQTYQNEILPTGGWNPTGDLSSASLEYSDLYQFYYSNYLADPSFIKVKNDRTIDFLRDDDYLLARLSKDSLLLEKVSFGENLELTTNSEIRFNDADGAIQDYITINSNGINLSSLNVNKKSHSYQFSTASATIASNYINIFNNSGTTGFLDEIVDGKTFLIKNLSSGNIFIEPAKKYLVNFTGFTGWGAQQYGVINFSGQNDVDLNIKKAYTRDGYSLLILENDTITGFGYDIEGTTFLGNSLTGVVELALGANFALALLNHSGQVTGWGDNFYGQATFGNNLTGVRKISAGEFHALALLNNGAVTGWGRNNNGQVAKITGYNNFFGTVTGGWNDSPVSTLTNVVDITAGSYFSLAILSGGGYNNIITGWGDNFYGQIASGLNLTGAVKVSAGKHHTLAIFNNNLRISGWGLNMTGQATGGNALTGALDISAGDFHSIAILNTNRRITGWGQNVSGQALGGNNLTGAYHISAGGLQSVAVFYPRQDESFYRGNETLPSTYTSFISTQNIENDTSLTLAKKQSVELLGIKNANYTGWITLNTNAGVI